MTRFSVFILAAGVFVPGLALAASEIELIDGRTPWRAYLVHGPNLSREQGALKVAERRGNVAFEPAAADPEKLGFSPLPPEDWHRPEFDDHFWPRYVPADLSDFLGDYGVAIFDRSWPALLCLRTCFGIAEPSQVTDLKLTITCLGGAVVYVNGQEVGRGFLPPGKLTPLTPADDYPATVYVTDDGTTPLPVLTSNATPEPKWQDRYQRRLRAFTLAIPAKMLVKGRNVLAVEIHRAAVSGALGPRGGWSHLGINALALTSASGKGVIPYAEAIKGTRLWSANPEDQVANNLSQQPLIRQSMFKTLIWARGMPVRGISLGNPFDPPRPVKMAVPRNGVASGQTVLSDVTGLRGVKATLGPLRGPQGAALPAAAVKIRYAAHHARIHFCDALLSAPPENVQTLPVWLIVEVPKDQPPGWYVGALNLEANSQRFTVPVQVLVTGHALCDARYFTSHIGVTHSPDTIARHYQVEPWSDEHFRLLEPSLALLGQLGNDVVHVPVITRNQFNWRMPLIRWTKTPQGRQPDYALLRKYLDLYVKHCAPPKALCLYIWDVNCAKQVANVYEGRQIPSRSFTPKMPLMVLEWDPATGESREVEVPHIGDPGSEQFWKPMIEGVRELLETRGWPVQCLMLGLGGDNRPSQEAAAAMREWAPYARWNLLSHFSGDPGQLFYRGPYLEQLKAGKLIAVGGLEVGLKEHPWTECRRALTAVELEKRLANPPEFIELGTARWHWQDYSPPLTFRTLPLLWGNLGRIGLDFWSSEREGPRNTSYFTNSSALTVPGPRGAIPTVRFQMLREGVQEMEVRLDIIRAYAKLSEEQRKPYRALLDEFCRRIQGGQVYLSQIELAYDWPSYVAAVQMVAAELAGVKTDCRWDSPPQ